MKKPLSIMLLAIMALSASFPAFAQKTQRIRPITPVTTTADYENIAQFESINAFSDGQGVYIRWEMRAELNTIGFFVYRTSENGNELIAPLVMTKVGQRSPSNNVYELFDTAGSLSSTYFIQTKFGYGSPASTSVFSPKYTESLLMVSGHTRAEWESMSTTTNGQLRNDNLALPSTLQSVVNQSILPPDLATQQRITTQQGVKIAVKKEGMYRVTRAELQAAGFDVNSNPANWRLFTSGNEQAIIVSPTGQYVDFYGKGIDVRETDTRIYFLIADSVAGKRIISKILNNVGGNVISNNYRLGVEKKERLRDSFSAAITNGETENYWGRPVYSDFPNCTATAPCITVNLSGVDTTGLDAVISLTCQGLPFTNRPHAIKVRINEHDVIGTVDGLNTDNFSGSLSFPASFLVEGDNTLKFATSTSADAVFFDKAKIEYTKRYLADQNKILFFSPGYRKIDVNGFTSSNIRVFDTTLDGNPQMITNLPITQNGSTFSVRTPSNRPAVMYAVEDSGLLQSPSVIADAPSSLGTTSNVADMIIISYGDPDFMAASETWANYRRSTAGGNFTSKVVDITDIYDEFGYGMHSSMAINRFLEYANTTWQNPKPHYVLLIGDTSTDARNYINLGYNDLVPSKHVSLIYEDTHSDEALADFNHDGLGEMAVGRIPARTASVISTVLGKTMAFETPTIQSLDRGALFAFDRPEGFDFRAMSLFLGDQLPASVPKTFVSRMLPPDYTSSDPAAHQTLMDEMNTGKYIVNYSGHGGAGFWANSSFFNSNDVPLLTNASRQSIFTMLTCWNGMYMWDRNDSLAEVLLKATNGGAAATWASSTETTPDYQLTMGARFYLKIGEGNIKRIGDLVIDAKSTIAGSDVGYSWVLLGDPALKVRQ